jgi:hypothetical protein
VRATVTELARAIDGALMPSTIGALVAQVAAVLARACEEQLTSVALEVTRERAYLDVRFSVGEGANPDDYEHTDLRWTITMARAGDDDEDDADDHDEDEDDDDEEGVLVDAFSDGVQRGPALAARFARAIDHRRDASSLKARGVRAIERDE